MAALSLGVPGTCPTVILQGLNALAIIAANASDIETVSLAQEVLNRLSLVPIVYQGIAATTAPFLNATGYPYGFQTFDANAAVAKQLGVSGTLLGA